ALFGFGGRAGETPARQPPGRRRYDGVNLSGSRRSCFWTPTGADGKSSSYNQHNRDQCEQCRKWSASMSTGACGGRAKWDAEAGSKSTAAGGGARSTLESERRIFAGLTSKQ